MRDTTVPGRTHNPCVTASPGLTVTSARPAAQLAAEGAGVMADADRLGSLGLAGLIEEGTVDRGAEGGVGVLVDGPAGRLPDGTPADRPPAEELQAARTNTPATIHALAHHRMPEPPGPLVRIPACPVGADRIARRASWTNRCALACAEAHHRGLHPQRSAAGRQRPGPYGPARCGHGGGAVSGGGEAATGDGDGDGDGDGGGEEPAPVAAATTLVTGDQGACGDRRVGVDLGAADLRSPVAHSGGGARLPAGRRR
jgi:alkylhydroperoxidase family enzyme